MVITGDNQCLVVRVRVKFPMASPDVQKKVCPPDYSCRSPKRHLNLVANLGIGKSMIDRSFAGQQPDASVGL